MGRLFVRHALTNWLHSVKSETLLQAVAWSQICAQIAVVLFQVSQVFDKEVLEEAQCPRLATSDCF